MYSTTSPLLTTLLLLLLLLLLRRTSAACHPDDHSGLLSFKSGITEDPTGILGSWVPSTDCCSWRGVTCESNNRVVTLSVYADTFNPGSYLSGTISSSLAKLRYMTGIYLMNTRNITGPFPSFLSTIPELQYIYLDNNKLSGPIPDDIGTRFAKLVALSMSYNRFTGRIPISMVKLRYLTLLNLAGNLLTGKIPDYIGNFKALDSLDLSANQLTGTVPSTLKNLSTLSHLKLGHNQLTGTVPSTLSNLSNLFTLNLAHNDLVGPFPELKVNGIIDLSYNKFNFGKIPNWIASLSSINLAGCGLKFNLDTFKPIKTNGTYPYEYVDLSDNQISGSPIDLLNYSIWMQEFSASGNQLRFNISQLEIPSNLLNMNLSRNQIYGNITASIAGMDAVDLSHNHLCGQIPFTYSPAESFEGNDCLCGSPLPACKN